MLRLFSTIREQLMNSGQIGRYLKYAVGEVVLIVLGILIALSINNWNQKRVERKKEQAILQQLKTEYEANRVQLEEKIQMRNDIIESSIVILSYIDQSEPVVLDSVTTYMGPLYGDPTFDPIYNDLINSGNIRLIQNQKLKNLLTNWLTDVKQLQEIELEWRLIYREMFLPKTFELGISRDIHDGYWRNQENLIFLLDKETPTPLKIGKSRLTPSTRQILTDQRLEGILSSAISVNQVANLESQALMNRIQEIAELIEQEMDE